MLHSICTTIHSKAIPPHHHQCPTAQFAQPYTLLVFYYTPPLQLHCSTSPLAQPYTQKLFYYTPTMLLRYTSICTFNTFTMDYTNIQSAPKPIHHLCSSTTRPLAYTSTITMGNTFLQINLHRYSSIQWSATLAANLTLFILYAPRYNIYVLQSMSLIQFALIHLSTTLLSDSNKQSNLGFIRNYAARLSFDKTSILQQHDVPMHKLQIYSLYSLW